MKAPRVRPIVIAAGGTGGHFFPAEALASALIARGHRVALMTDARSGALKSAVFAGRETFVLPGSGIAGRGMVKAVRAGFSLVYGIWRAIFLLQKLNPTAVIGFGGYPSVPPIIAASLRKKTPVIFLHEQNAVIGRANRMMARFADRLALGMTDTAGIPANVPSFVTGNPVRPVIAALAKDPYVPPTDEIRLLVVGGSLGAQIFGDIVPVAVASLPADIRVRLSVTQQCRIEDMARVRQAYKACGVPADLAPFFSDIAVRLAAAHLVIGRAGASTCAELAVAGRPAILVPLPSAIDDHQTANARALATAGAASVIAQKDFTALKLTTLLTEWFVDPRKLEQAALAARGCGAADAAEKLAEQIEIFLAEKVAQA
jgi:UDP-N-acetylglucosamine--N-acetylmuramyl-(pentapeptide) pyrophosphoryl-undecaprenol N-acetylglucosamine transferase